MTGVAVLRAGRCSPPRRVRAHAAALDRRGAPAGGQGRRCFPGRRGGPRDAGRARALAGLHLITEPQPILMREEWGELEPRRRSPAPSTAGAGTRDTGAIGAWLADNALADA